MENSVVNVAVLCLSGNRPILAYASYKNSALHIIKSEHKDPNISQLTEEIAKKQDIWAERGFSFFVDDPSGILKDYGYHIGLADKDEFYGTVMNAALGKYFTLHSSGAISFPPNGIFEIQRNQVNIKTRAAGDVEYQLDWNSLSDESRVMLLCIHACMGQSMAHADYYAQMCAHLNAESDHDNGDDEVNRVINAFMR